MIGKCLRIVVSMVVLTGVAGCGFNQMRLVNYANAEKPEELQQTFSQTAYAENGSGGYEILLQSTEPIAASDNRVLRQAIYISTIWKAIPGKTYAETTQINARIIYLVEIAERPGGIVQSQAGPTFLCYKGSGFVTFDIDRMGRMTGRIEQSLLTPTHQGKSHRLGTFELSGNFLATRSTSAIGEFKIIAGPNLR